MKDGFVQSKYVQNNKLLKGSSTDIIPFFINANDTIGLFNNQVYPVQLCPLKLYIIPTVYKANQFGMHTKYVNSFRTKMVMK